MPPKTNIEQLAAFGGRPAFENPLHVGRPNIGNRERLLALINDMLDRVWLSNNGPYVQQLERDLCALLGVKHCIPMCNGTGALEITIRALGLRGEVIVPSFTFIATAHALQWQEITPVFCDIDPRTCNLDPRCVEKMITPRTSGILGVHVWGRPCAIDELSRIARDRGLRLLFDAAHALGSSYGGRMIGNFGEAEVFSFHATKFFNTFEGGAVATNNDELAGKMRLMTNFGFSGYDNVIYLGTNGKMSEASAAMGLAGLESLDAFIEHNRSNYQKYRRELADIPGISIIPLDDGEKNNFQYVVLEIDEATTHLSRDRFLQILHGENVLARRYFYPGCHRMEPYRSFFPHAGLLLPETERLCRRVLSLPTGPSVQEHDIESICGIIRLLTRQGGEVATRMGQMPDIHA